MSDGFDSKGLAADVGQVKKEMEALGSVIDSVSKKLGGLGGGLANVGGQGQLGLGNAGSNILGGSFGKISAIASVIGGVGKAALGVAGGAMMAMPNVDATMGMAMGGYNAAVMSGRTNFNKVLQGTFSTLNGGANIVGAPGVVAQSLAAQGIYFGKSGLAGGAGQYNNITRAIGGAAKYMNISNDVAAQAIGGFYSGSTSMNLMQQAGVMTTGPQGQSASPVQLLAMLNQRLTGGGRMSYKQLQTSLGPGGMMTANINSIVQDPTQRSMLRQYMLDASQGKFWNSKTYGAELAKNSGGNTQQPQMDALTAQTQPMITATQAYVDGMNKAVGVIKQFETAMNNFLKTPAGNAMAQANAGINLASKDPAVAGTTAGAAGGLSGLLAAGGAAATYLGGKKLLTKLGLLETPKSVGSQNYNFLRKLGVNAKTASKLARGAKFLKGAGPLIGLAASGVTLGADALSGQGWGSKQFTKDMGGAIGATAGGLALGAVGSALLPGIGTVAGGMLGSWLGGMAGDAIGGFFSGGDTNLNGLGGSSATNTKVTLVAPVNGPITTKYGQTTDIHGTALWGGEAHKAIDYGVPKGTKVQAAASGTISESGSGSGSRSYGNYIVIDHGGGISTLYAHLSSAMVSKGMSVVQGEVIGLSGDTGYVTGAHLHFEARQNGNKVNPASLGMKGNIAVVAGNANSTASNSDGGSSGGSAGSAGALGFDAGSGNSGTKIPESYMGAMIGQNSTGVIGMAGGNKLSATSASNSSYTGASNSYQGGPGLSVGKDKNNVTINVSVASASELEARRLAKIIKEYLDEDEFKTNMRSL